MSSDGEQVIQTQQGVESEGVCCHLQQLEQLRQLVGTAGIEYFLKKTIGRKTTTIVMSLQQHRSDRVLHLLVLLLHAVVAGNLQQRKRSLRVERLITGRHS
jgi:hypothetical protein